MFVYTYEGSIEHNNFLSMWFAYFPVTHDTTQQPGALWLYNTYF